MSTTTTRTRGLAPWHPRAATLALLDTVRGILTVRRLSADDDQADLLSISRHPRLPQKTRKPMTGSANSRTPPRRATG